MSFMAGWLCPSRRLCLLAIQAVRFSACSASKVVRMEYMDTRQPFGMSMPRSCNRLMRMGSHRCQAGVLPTCLMQWRFVQLEEAVADGADVRGFMYWTLVCD